MNFFETTSNIFLAIAVLAFIHIVGTIIFKILGEAERQKEIENNIYEEELRNRKDDSDEQLFMY